MAKQKIAILGGGMAALTTAFELTGFPGWKDRYEITIYQQGHRLGGKGASGRNRKKNDRIEEHGLHIWMGFYENAFSLIRKCYEELARGPKEPLATWDQAFKPHSFIALEELHDGVWKPWPLDFHTNRETPGDGGGRPPTPWGFVARLLDWMVDVFDSFGSGVPSQDGPAIQAVREGGVAALEGGSPILDAALGVLHAVFAAADVAAHRALPALPRMLRGVRDLAMGTAEPSPSGDRRDHARVADLLEQFMRWLKHAIGELCDRDDDARRTFILLDLGATNVLGIIRDGIIFPPYDFRQIDDLDYKAWLRKHGADEVTIESPPVNALYDLVFSREAGIAAGTTISGGLRMFFTYKGAVFYKMQAGMGDTVFTPLYTVLKRRGVAFKFFHRVEKLHVSGDGSSIDRVTIARQATTKSGGEYQPLYDVKDLPCWPSEPLWDQLVEGDDLERRHVDLESAVEDFHVETLELRSGRDFDALVLGVSIGAFPKIAGELLDKDARLREMVAKVATTRTQALQLWFKPTLAQLGWKLKLPVVGTYAKPFDTWADMTHLVARETWEGTDVPGNLAYLCGALNEPPPGSKDDPASELARVRKNCVDWLTAKGPHGVWPLATEANDPEALNWYFLADPEDRKGEARLDAQYFRANVNPSDRYVLTPAGSTKARVAADASGFANLFFAGDWVDTAINGGCIEAATMAGMAASRAICGYPETIWGEREKPSFQVPIEQGLPRYIERGSGIVLRQPFAQKRTTLFGFVLDADEASLRAACDRYLNIGGATTYRPVGPFVMCAAAAIGELRSLDPQDRDKGWASENDVAFWVPVLAEKAGAPARIAWFIPYVFVDNVATVASGREIYGFPKEQGIVSIPRSPTDPFRVSVDAAVLARFSPSTKAEIARVLEIRRTGLAAELDRREAWEGIDGALSAVRGAIAGLGSIGPLVDEALARELTLVFLKQFRDAVDPTRACYRAVIEAPSRVTRFGGGGVMPGDFEIALEDYDSLPIARELGLARRGPIPARLAVWLDFDFDLGDGREIFRG